MNIHEGLPYLYNIFMLLTCAYAVFRGHRTEYVGAAIMITGSLISSAVSRIFETTWTGFEYAIFVVDIVALAALISLTITSSRFGPIWAAAFHLVAVTIHAAMIVAPDITPWAFATGAAFWAYAMLLALAIGANEYVRPNEANHIPSG